MNALMKGLTHGLKVMAVTVCLLGGPAWSAEPQPIRIGWVAWPDAEISAKLAAYAIEQQLHRPVKLVMADIGIQFKAMESGDIDFIPMVWLPTTHKGYWDKYQNKLEDLGVLYEGRIGWTIPDSIPRETLSSIADLNKPEVREQLRGTILGPEPGTGQFTLSQKAIDVYGITGYKLVSSSGAAEVAQFAREIERGHWSLLNGWNPHWMFAKWKLRYLDDPKGVFGSTEQVHIIGRPGLREAEPAVAAFLKNYTLPLPQLEALLLQAKDSSADAAVKAYYAANKPTFDAMFAPQATAAAQ